MIQVALFALIAQAALMLVDEFHFHRRRDLPRWERIGHPVDTLSVLVCYAIALGCEWSPRAATAYGIAALVSCILITKDEFVHAVRCQPAEHWLHSVLFVLHPIVLGAAALLWNQGEFSLLWMQAGLTLAFAGYQTLYWNVPWQRLLRAR